jgi:ubiquinone biosynthesis protein COQ9
MAIPPQGENTITIVLQFIKDSLPMIGGIIAIWKTISEVAKYFAKKQDARLRELIQSEVTPQIENLTHAIDALREEIGRLKK